MAHTSAADMIQSSVPHDLLLILQYTRIPKVIKARTVKVMTLPARFGASSAIMAMVSAMNQGVVSCYMQKVSIM